MVNNGKLKDYGIGVYFFLDFFRSFCILIFILFILKMPELR